MLTIQKSPSSFHLRLGSTTLTPRWVPLLNPKLLIDLTLHPQTSYNPLTTEIQVRPKLMQDTGLSFRYPMWTDLPLAPQDRALSKGILVWVCKILHIIRCNLMCLPLQLNLSICITWGFQGGTSGKEPACQGSRQKRCGFHHQVRMISWSRKRLSYSSTLAWRIPWAEKPGGLQSIRLKKAGHDWSDLAHVL